MPRPATRSSTRLAQAPQAKLYTTLKASKASVAGVTKRKVSGKSAAAAPAPAPVPAPLSPAPTNAPLSPAPAAIPAAIDTTETSILSQALTHLTTQAPALAPLIAAHPCHLFSPAGLAARVDPFEALVSSIVSQQVSGAAAKSIKARLLALFAPSAISTDSPSSTPPAAAFPTPAVILATPLETLRTAGLSGRKAEYLHALAEAFQSGALNPALFESGTDEEITAALTAVRGIGAWSAEMFLMFALKRLDVFSTGDLGIQKGMASFCLGRNVSREAGKGKKGKWKFMTEAEMVEQAERYRPYRSVFCWYMWRVGDVVVDAMGGDGEGEGEAKVVKKGVKKAAVRKKAVKKAVGGNAFDEPPKEEKVEETVV
ncbi:DNA glycosylase [Geopyxis carbonaria]|nr:DNA glycosylase [Geopyxis carbonaria]